MSLPPVTVQIKRKATDDPVDFLRVHEPHGKRQRRATDFVFSRQSIPDTANENNSTTPSTFADRPIKQAHPTTNTKFLSQNGGQVPNTRHGGYSTSVTEVNKTNQSAVPFANGNHNRDGVEMDGDSQVLLDTSQLRRFHMSRDSTPTDPLGPRPGGQVQKRTSRPPTAVFVERKARSGASVVQKVLEYKNVQASSGSTLKQADARAQKKPGLAARTSTVPKPRLQAPKSAQSTSITPSGRNMRLPSGLVMPWDVNSEQLAAEMQAYTLQEIGKNIVAAKLAREDFQPAENIPQHKRPQSRFTPKKPTLRYIERHSGETLEAGLVTNMDVDSSFSGDDMEDDSEYVIDTYVRVPADTFEPSENQKIIGLLVLESQPDIDEFYMEDSESEEEEEDEEEDENAENHYTADYPDDEVESDDEYDRNPYSYRTHNASDLEEFDEDDAVFSDDEADRMRYPWAKIPCVKREGREVVLGGGNDSE